MKKLESLNFIDLIHDLIDLTIEQFLQNLKYVIVCTVVFFTLICRNMNYCRKIFRLFFKYWEIVAKRGTQYSGLEVFAVVSYIFDIL